VVVPFACDVIVDHARSLAAAEPQTEDAAFFADRCLFVALVVDAERRPVNECLVALLRRRIQIADRGPDTGAKFRSDRAGIAGHETEPRRVEEHG
jgi:hypothetical protein